MELNRETFLSFSFFFFFLRQTQSSCYKFTLIVRSEGVLKTKQYASSRNLFWALSCYHDNLEQSICSFYSTFLEFSIIFGSVMENHYNAQ